MHAVQDLDSDLFVHLMDSYSLNIVWGVLCDSSGRSTTICIDLRESSPTMNRLFEGARHPDKDGARLVEIGGVTEGIVVPVVSHWCDDYKNWTCNGGSYKEHFRDIVISALLSVGSTTYQMPSIDELGLDKLKPIGWVQSR